MIDYSIYENHITKNLFEFMFCGTQQDYELIHEAVKDEKDIENVLQTQFSNKKFYEAQETVKKVIKFDSQNSEEFFTAILRQVIDDFKSKKS